MTSITSAISAYRTAADPMAAVGSLSANRSDETDESVAAGGTDFSNMLKDAAKSAISQSQQAEQTSLSAVAGKSDIRDVVAAVANAELTLNTVVNIRDKVINAYKEILSMSI